MDLKIIAFILIIPTLILFWISFYHLKKLTAKITGVRNIKDLKGARDFVDKSFTSSDILLEIFFPKKYSKKYPDDFRKVRVFAIPAILFFIPTVGLIFYIVFKPYFINKEFGVPLFILGFILLSWIAGIALRKYRKRK